MSEIEAESSAFIYSSESLFTQSADEIVSGTNMRLFTASLSTFAAHEGSVSIPVKSLEITYLTIPQGTILLLALLTAVIIPSVFIVGGFIIWFRRRKR